MALNLAKATSTGLMSEHVKGNSAYSAGIAMCFGQAPICAGSQSRFGDA